MKYKNCYFLNFCLHFIRAMTVILNFCQILFFHYWLQITYLPQILYMYILCIGTYGLYVPIDLILIFWSQIQDGEHDLQTYNAAWSIFYWNIELFCCWHFCFVFTCVYYRWHSIFYCEKFMGKRLGHKWISSYQNWRKSLWWVSKYWLH